LSLLIKFLVNLIRVTLILNKILARLAIRLKLIEAPVKAQNLPLGKIRGSGRPSKVSINSSAFR